MGWRTAYGALKDSTKVGLAKLNSDFKELDVAIVKATSHVESPPKERHVRKIFAATSVLRPRADVAYCIHALARRLHRTHDWMVALKTLIVIHRTLREGDPIFREELLNYSHRAHVLQISNFKDDSSPLAWDCSAWVRTYALFLEERLECFKILKYDIEAERLVKSSQGATKGHSRTRHLSCNHLLEQLSALQQLLHCLCGCKPEGEAFTKYLIQYALALVLKESFKIYCAINDGIINLVDKFFEMSKHDAVTARGIYKRAGQQAENLSGFYEFCKGLELARTFQFPSLKQPPPSFLAAMEEYIKEAPQTGSISTKALEYHENKLSVLKEEQEECSPESPELLAEDGEKPPAEEPQQTIAVVEEQVLPQTTGDLLCLDEISPAAAELEESNAMALAIIPPGSDPKTRATSGSFESGTSGWELALVTAPSSNDSHLVESKLGGGFDRLLLDSLYENSTIGRQQNGGYGGVSPYQFGMQDPFSLSNAMAPPPQVQMAIMAQQQQQLYYQQQQQQQQLYNHHQQQQQFQQHNMMMMPYNYQPAMAMGMSSNPFADPFGTFTATYNTSHQGNSNLI